MSKIAKWCSIGIAMFGFSSLAHAQSGGTYPTEPITAVVAFSAGGGTDTLARMITADLGEVLGQSVIVENRPGASGFVGWRSAATAKPDGYTLLFSENAIAIGTALRPQRKFDPVTELEPIAQVATAPLVLVVRNGLEADTVPELVELSRSLPEGLSFSSSGIGSVSHMTFEALAAAAGINAVHVPYSGGGEALTAVAGGHADATMTTVHVASKMIKAGKVKGIAITGSERSPVLRDLQSLEEQGVKSDVHLTFWYGFFGPAGLPDEVVAVWSEAIQKTLNDPEVKKRLAAGAITPAYIPAADFGAKLGNEIDNWSRIIKEKGLELSE